MDDYDIERSAAVACGQHDPDHENCRHAWNAAHPDDPVTEAEQRAFEQSVMAAIRRHLSVTHGRQVVAPDPLQVARYNHRPVSQVQVARIDGPIRQLGYSGREGYVVEMNGVWVSDAANFTDAQLLVGDFSSAVLVRDEAADYWGRTTWTAS